MMSFVSVVHGFSKTSRGTEELTYAAMLVETNIMIMHKGWFGDARK